MDIRFGPPECPNCPGIHHYLEWCPWTEEAREKHRTSLLSAIEKAQTGRREPFFTIIKPQEKMMSWAVSKIGRAGKLAETIADTFKNAQGGFPGAETEVKNKCGEIAAALCAGMADPNNMVRIAANGSAWVETKGDERQYNSHSVNLEISTLGVLEE
ncbi:MAG: hypothetical protein KGL39_30795 [Patescibacteria group bacterium]|nr:hypothetical protein [Patescibacteria group bacterium]